MKALVVYESLFGNTELVASAVATGLRRHMDVEIRDVAEAPAGIDDLLDLIVVGGPTHAFSMSRRSTRDEARRRGAGNGNANGNGTANGNGNGNGGIGIREWLSRLHAGPHSELVATFDTRVDRVRHLPGSAARKAAHVVHRIGYDAAAKPMSFYLVDTPGPLVDGELARAEQWGERLGLDARARAAGRLTF